MDPEIRCQIKPAPAAVPSTSQSTDLETRFPILAGFGMSRVSAFGLIDALVIIRPMWLRPAAHLPSMPMQRVICDTFPCVFGQQLALGGWSRDVQS